jgi:DNA mismatch endonuclease, patch repair protein
MDFLSKGERSERMRLVKRSNTHPELVVRQFLHRRRFRFRLHSRALLGKPDIVLPKYRTVIFVHGCFWHGCPHCKKGSRRPATNAAYWAEKIKKNMQRDIRSQQLLEAAGWRVVIVWECEVKNESSLEQA